MLLSVCVQLHYVVDYQQSQLVKRGVRAYTTAPQARPCQALSLSQLQSLRSC